jgi:hypothetical protein
MDWPDRRKRVRRFRAWHCIYPGSVFYPIPVLSFSSRKSGMFTGSIASFRCLVRVSDQSRRHFVAPGRHRSRLRQRAQCRKRTVEELESTGVAGQGALPPTPNGGGAVRLIERVASPDLMKEVAWQVAYSNGRRNFSMPAWREAGRAAQGLIGRLVPDTYAATRAGAATAAKEGIARCHL